MYNAKIRAHSEPIFNKLEILKFDDLLKYNVSKFVHQYRTGRLPASFNGMFTLMRESDDRNSRDSFYNYKILTPKNKLLLSFPNVYFPQIWNSLDSVYQSIESHNVFKKDLTQFLLKTYENFVTCDDLSCLECRDAYHS